jgi:hypothetical protein
VDSGREILVAVLSTKNLRPVTPGLFYLSSLAGCSTLPIHSTADEASIDYFSWVKKLRLIGFLVLLISCERNPHDRVAWFDYEGGKAVGLRVYVARVSTSPSPDSLKVYVSGVVDPVLGTTTIDDNELVFTPVVPFTLGLDYDVTYAGELLGIVTGELDTTAPTPLLLATYPSSDTIPENLLKMYLSFSQPMVEGKSLTNIVLIRNGTDTIRDAFLDLQPELWDEDSRTLTLWLDPGRIKRDLIPNRKLGKPLISGNTYSLTVLPGWRSKAGRQTLEKHERKFLIGPRDEQSPSIGKWEIIAPGAGTWQPLTIIFGEQMDYLSAMHSIFIVNPDGALDGRRSMGQLEQSILFVPQSLWKKGEYTVEVEPRLEDLAGNNLTRLFDQDVAEQHPVAQGQRVITIRFVIL